LYTAGVFDFESGLNLVKKRAELMDTAAGGTMAALMKFDRDLLETVIAQTPDVVLANDNSTAQVVISGTPEAVDLVLSKVKSKRAVELNVSGAFHSPLMQAAAVQFESMLNSVTFREAKIPVSSNIEPIPTTDATDLKQRLIAQMTGSVRWREIMLQLPIASIDKAIEVGPGKVLTGLIKRTCREIALVNVGTLEQLEQI
jgi:[acyl-carrier-protein] S-malonyltransferase